VAASAIGVESGCRIELSWREASTMPLEIVKQPYLDQLRAEVAVLKRVVEGEPDRVAVARAWASVGKIQEALRELCPNHPHICTTPDRRTPSKPTL
jgi:hypothetical protein